MTKRKAQEGAGGAHGGGANSERTTETLPIATSRGGDRPSRLKWGAQLGLAGTADLPVLDCPGAAPHAVAEVGVAGSIRGAICVYPEAWALERSNKEGS